MDIRSFKAKKSAGIANAFFLIKQPVEHLPTRIYRITGGALLQPEGLFAPG